MPCVPQEVRPTATAITATLRARIFGWARMRAGIYRLAFMRLRLLAPAAIASLLLAGCGAARTARLAAHELRLTLSEYRIAPQSTSVPAGRLRIVAHNRGILTHNLELERGSLDSTERTVLAVVHTLLPRAH